MMILIYIFILAMGVLLSLILHPELSLLELIGISFPFGLGIWSVQLWLMDVIGLEINNRATITIGCILIIGLLTYFIRKQKDSLRISIDSFKSIHKNPLKPFIENPLSINPLYVLLIVLVAFIVFIIASKTLYWPIINYDSIDGYDLIAKAIGAEGSYNNSVFDPQNPSYSIRSFYPPLLVHGLSISYIFGAGHSKLTAVIFLVSTIVTLYALVLKNQTHIQAITAVFILCIIPEFMGQSALTASNPVAACFLLISLGFFHRYLLSGDRHAFVVSMVALGFTIWTRTEAVIFAVPMSILLYYKSDFKSGFRQMSALAASTLIPFISWQLFIKTLSSAPERLPVIKRLFFDAERLGDLWGQIKLVLFDTQFYALGIYLLIFCLLTNMIFYKKARAIQTMSFILVMSFILYVWVYYQLDTDYKVYHKGSWIGSGFKRGLFYFLPIGCYYVGCSYILKLLLLRRSDLKK